MTTPDQIAGWIVGTFGVVMAIGERLNTFFKSKKVEVDTEAVSNAKMYQERAKALEAERSEWKGMWEEKNKELTEYREFVHGKEKEIQSTNLDLHNQVELLSARPDFSTLFSHLEAQAKVQTQTLAAVEGLAKMMQQFMERSNNQNT